MPGWPTLAVAVPLLAACVLAGLPRRWGQGVNLAACLLGLAVATRLPAADPGGWLLAGPAASFGVLLNGVLGVAAALYSRAAAPPGRLRLYHAVFQLILASAQLALLADDAAIAWLALEAASAALLAAAYAGQPGTRSAWPALVLLAGPLALAASGTLLLALAAGPVPGADALRWSVLAQAAPRCDGAILSLAFLLLLLGLAALAALAPMQAWLMEVQDAAPVALGGILGGTLPVAALILALRLRGLVAANPQAIAPGGPMVALGLAALLASAAGLWRAHPGRRWLALSSAGQNGVALVAFGLGSAGAGLLHLAAHALVKAAAFGAESHGPARLARLPLAALAGLPPFALFSSLALITLLAAQRSALLAIALGAGLAASAAAAILRPAPPRQAAPAGWALAGTALCLAGALALGLAMPGPLAAWFAAAP